MGNLLFTLFCGLMEKDTDLPIRPCLECGKPLTGRKDQKFCSAYCRTSYHYELSKDKTDSFYLRIDRQLKRNRRILKDYNKAGKATVRKAKLISEGFDPNYFTHYWKTTKGQVYLFCYEYGFLSLHENGKEKYLLVTWQDYMNKKK